MTAQPKRGRPARTDSQKKALAALCKWLQDGLDAGQHYDGVPVKWTQDKFAERLGVGRDQVKRWLDERAPAPPNRMGWKIVNVFYGDNPAYAGQRDEMLRLMRDAGTIFPDAEEKPRAGLGKVATVRFSEVAVPAILKANQADRANERNEAIVPFTLMFRVDDEAADDLGQDQGTLGIGLMRAFFECEGNGWQPVADSFFRTGERPDGVELVDDDVLQLTGKDNGPLTGAPLGDLAAIRVEPTTPEPGAEGVTFHVKAPRRGAFHVELDGQPADAACKTMVTDAILRKAIPRDERGRLKIASATVTIPSMKKE